MNLRLADFHLVRYLGAGASGEVHEAFDQRRKMWVALKRLRGADPEALYRFKKEFRVVAGIFHPNLAALHDLFTEQEDWFITMELVRGTSIVGYGRREDLLAFAPTEQPGAILEPVDDAGPDVPRVRASFAQLARGIGALHEAGCVHRDLKPSNVLVTGDGVVKVLDFGHVTELHGGASFGRAIGASAYVAPEQARGEPVDGAADWYSVGALLYEALTGRLPFEGPAHSVLHAKQHGDPEDPRALRGDLPDDLCDLCLRMLDREPAARPLALEIGERLEARRVSSPRPAAPSSPPSLFGREGEMQALARAFEESRAGAVVVHVAGPAGIGKTSLVRTFLARPEVAGGAVVLSGRCYEGDAVAFKAVDTIVDALTARLSRAPERADRVMATDFRVLMRLFPTLRRLEVCGSAPPRQVPSDPFEVRRRGFAALRDMLGRMAAERPLVLFIDDLQWGDADSAALLGEIVRPPDAPPLLLVLAYRRDGEGGDVIRTLREGAAGASGAARVLDLRPLRSEDVTALAESLLSAAGTAAEGDVAAIVRESGGDPSFVHELARHVIEGARSTDDVSFDDLIAKRVERLDPAARSVLEAAAVAASHVDVARLREATELHGEAFTVALATLKSEHLLRTHRAGGAEVAETYHQRIGERTLALLEPARVREWHARLAAVLEKHAGADPEVVARHHRGAGDLERAIPHVERAAQNAERSFAFERAVALCRLLVDLGAQRGLSSGAARLRLAEALVRAGRGGEAADEFLAVADARPGQRFELWRRAGEQLLATGRFDRGLALLRQVLAHERMSLPRPPSCAVLLVFLRAWLTFRGAELDPAGPTSDEAPRVRARVDACIAAARGMLLVDGAWAELFTLRGLLLAVRAGDAARASPLLCQQATFEAARATSDRGRARAALAQEGGERLAIAAGDVVVRAAARTSRGVQCFFRGEWREAVAALDEGEAMGLRHPRSRVPFELGRVFAAVAETYAGRYAAAWSRREAGLRDARARGDILIEGLYAYGELALVGLARDDGAGVRGAIESARGRSPRLTPIQVAYAEHGLALVDLYEGRPQDALDRYDHVNGTLQSSRLLRLPLPALLLRFARGAARLALALASRGDDGARHLERARRDARAVIASPHPIAPPLGALLEAGCAAAGGDRDGARDRLRLVAPRLEALGMLAHAAAARRSLGASIGGDEGAAVIAAADATLRAAGVVAPERLARVLAPALAR